MASTSNSLSSSTTSSSLTSAGINDSNNSANISNSTTNKVANMSGDGNSNDTLITETSSATVNNIELEYKKIKGDRNGWHRLYQEIKEKSEREANDKHFASIESEKPQNRVLNRYRDVNPYDHSRIIINRGGVDYINANLVKLERADRKYILTQGPLSDTVGHFWLMVWEQNTRAILMLNKLIEKKQIKCHLYWPERKGSENALKLDDVKLAIEFQRCEEYKNFCVRWFKLTDFESNQSREIIQFHYTTWPDFGIPSSPVAFLQFLKQVRDSGALDSEFGPAVVHCSAGIGRSGTFCLVDCCLVLIDKEGVQNVLVQDVLYELRRYRMGLIQTADQLYFSYQSIIEGIKLLKDPKFIDYNESPIVTSDDSQDYEQYIIDETPPPLPPRTHSLLPLTGADGILKMNLLGSQSKPLPKIPASVSFNDDLYAPGNDNSNKDALNNFINTESCSENNRTMTNRPLPPLPAQNNSLNRVHESDSDENDHFENDDSEEDDIDEAYDDEDVKNMDDINFHKMQNKDKQNNYPHQQQQHNKVKTNDQNKDHDDSMKLNGIETAHSGSASSDTEIRRRKRAERRSNIEEKVTEIKRKQRENEDKKKSAKKRRSLITYLTAGVIVGVICAYAYSKWA